jgi:hypothetical protein
MSKEFKPPKSLATCADMLYKLREERYALNKQVDALQEKETALREYLINNLPKSSATGISGKLATVKVELKRIVQVEDWDKLQKYIIKNASKGSFALLQRRVNATAVEEIWADKKTVPGCVPFSVPVVSVTKR